MKNIKKRRFPAKLLLGIVLLGMCFTIKMDVSFAQLGPREGENINWNEKCHSLKFFGCAFKRQCRWSDTEDQCVAKVDKKDLKAANRWKKEYCDPEAGKVRKELGEVKYRLYSDGEEKEDEVQKACEDLFDNYKNLGNDYNDNVLHVCDYPNWLTNAGKRKCRHFWDRLNRLNEDRCKESVLMEWESGLKDSDARRKKREEMRECEEQEPLYTEALYDGPVFNGPGLRGGAEMAQMQLSSSISKQRDLKKLIIGWSKFALEIAAVVAVMALIYAGFRYITDMGDGGGVEAAKKIIIWVVVGLLLILSAYAIVNTVIKARFGAESGRASITINKIIT